MQRGKANRKEKQEIECFHCKQKDGEKKRQRTRGKEVIRDRGVVPGGTISTYYSLYTDWPSKHLRLNKSMINAVSNTVCFSLQQIF